MLRVVSVKLRLYTTCEATFGGSLSETTFIDAQSWASTTQTARCFASVFRRKALMQTWYIRVVGSANPEIRKNSVGSNAPSVIGQEYRHCFYWPMTAEVLSFSNMIRSLRT